MNSFLHVICNGLQIPAPGLTVAEARIKAEKGKKKKHSGPEVPAQADDAAKAVQSQQKEPAISTPESIENGEVSVKTQPTQEGA